MRQPETIRDYLDDLRRAVAWRRGAREAAEVVADYQELFAAGLSQGKSELELCHTLDKPNVLACALSAEARERRRPPLCSLGTTVRLLGTGLLLCLFVFAVWYCRRDSFDSAAAAKLGLWMGTLIPLLCPVAAYLLWTGYLPAAPLHGNRAGRLLRGLHLLILTGWVVVFFMQLWTVLAYVFQYPVPLLWGADPHNVGPSMYLAAQFAAALMLLLLPLALANSIRLSARFFTAAAMAAGALFSMGYLYGSWNGADPSHLDHTLLLCVKLPLRPFLASLASSLLLLALFKRGGGRRGRAA